MYRQSAESHPSCDVLSGKGNFNGREMIFNSLVSIHSAQRLAVPFRLSVYFNRID